MAELRFLSNEGDIDEGLGDAGIETFRDAPYASIARECGQNSLDARDKAPVLVSFDVIEIAATELPSLELFRSSMECCLKKAKSLKIEKEIEFFECAKEALSHDKIKILNVHDNNTKGLVGPCVQGTPFHSLLKGAGVSVKNDPTSGGSFGIGKNAAFAVSDIQTVFYSTMYRNPETENTERLHQGKTKLVSHADINDKKNLATGYWGEKEYKPISKQESVPVWLRREDIGTSIYCICFRESENWELRLAASLLQNFFCAVHRNEMNFSINNEDIKINKDSMMSLFERTDIRQAAAYSGNEEDYTFSRSLYECLIAVETKEEIIEISQIGKVSVRILVKEGLPKRVCFIRNGMYIADNLENFGEKFLRFPLYKDFVALVEPLDDIGITLFKKLENPKHNGFSAERLSSEQKRDIATTAVKNLGKLIRGAIKAQSLEAPKNSVSINELSEFFADEIDPEKIQDPNAVEEDPETYRYKPKKRKQQKKQGLRNGDKGVDGGAGTDSGKGKGSNGGGRGTGSGAGGSGSKSAGRPITLVVNRNLISEGNLKKRHLILTAAESCKAIVTILAEGLNNTEKLELVNADVGMVISGALELELKIDKKNKILVEFTEEYDGPIEVVAVSSIEGVGSET